MTSNAFDVQIPATEIRIAEAINWSEPFIADVIRRLAFERDRLKEDNATVRRIWETLGISNYADAKGMSIVEHVADLKRRAEHWERLHDYRTAELQAATGKPPIAEEKIEPWCNTTMQEPLALHEQQDLFNQMQKWLTANPTAQKKVLLRPEIENIYRMRATIVALHKEIAAGDTAISQLETGIHAMEMAVHGRPTAPDEVAEHVRLTPRDWRVGLLVTPKGAMCWYYLGRLWRKSSLAATSL